MSRHRAFRNLDLEAELADADYEYDDDPYEDIDDTDRQQLESAYATILDVLGPPNTGSNPFTQREIKDTLWDAYFDTESVLDNLVREAEKRNRKNRDPSLCIGPLDQDAAMTVGDGLSRLSLAAYTGRGRSQRIGGLISRGRQGRRGEGIVGLANRNLGDMAPGGLSGVAVNEQRAFGPTPGDLGNRSPANATGLSKLALIAQKKKAQQQQMQASGHTGAHASFALPLSPSKGPSDAFLRPSTEQTSSSSSTFCPSKLMTLAQGRKGFSLGVFSSSAVETKQQDLEGHESPQPVSKLQQRAIAARKEREAREAAAASLTSAVGSAAGAENSMKEIGAINPTPEEVLPGGVAESVLFPKRGATSGISTSAIGTLLFDSMCDAVASPAMPLLSPEPSKKSLRDAFSGPSPDDAVVKARSSTKLAASAKKSGAWRPQGLAVKGHIPTTKAAGSSSGTPSAVASKATTPHEESSALVGRGTTLATLVQGIDNTGISAVHKVPLPKPASHDKILQDWKVRQQEAGAKKDISIVVVGHVDAGKSTLMGRVLHDVGSLSDREHSSHERASAKIGKGSFAYAWALDASGEERERGVTISTAHATFTLPHRNYTVLDAPGHRDFVPSMITGAAQADAALLVIDASKGAFEAGFGPRGQTREHAVLIRALGVRDLVVVVNKLDTLEYDQTRFNEILAQLRPFLSSIGFEPTRVTFLPLGAAAGENVSRTSTGGVLGSWYSGPTLLAVLDSLDPPTREVDAPLRMPLTNVFRGQTAISSGLVAAGRVVSGLVAIGDRLLVVPGDETAMIRAIEQDGEGVPWAVAGSSVTVYLAGIDEIHLAVGSLLCPPNQPVPLSRNLLVQLLVFDPTYPILTGSVASLHHHSLDVPCTVTDLVATIDKGGTNARNGAKKRKPRVLGKGATAMVRITVQSPGLPVEVARKDLARVLLRMHGETVAAGMVVECN